MTDGERLVWSARYALSLSRDGDVVVAVMAATKAVTELRALEADAVAYAHLPHAAREFLDEIVNVP